MPGSCGGRVAIAVSGQGVLDDEPVRSSRRRSTRIALVAVLGLLLAALLPLPAAVAAPKDACDNRTNNTYQKLLECVTLDGVREHQAQFQKIADSNDDPFYPGTRARAPRATRTASTTSPACCGPPATR